MFVLAFTFASFFTGLFHADVNIPIEPWFRAVGSGVHALVTIPIEPWFRSTPAVHIPISPVK